MAFIACANLAMVPRCCSSSGLDLSIRLDPHYQIGHAAERRTSELRPQLVLAIICDEEQPARRLTSDDPRLYVLPNVPASTSATTSASPRRIERRFFSRSSPQEPGAAGATWIFAPPRDERAERVRQGASGDEKDLEEARLG